MTPYAEGTLVKEHSRAEVYRITDAAKLHIPSAYAFDALGYKWNDVVHVADGALSEIPTDTWPSHSPTPGSLVWFPDEVYTHLLSLSGSRSWRVWDRGPVRTRELRGWLSVIEQGCNPVDPDWHWKLVLDIEWARRQGIDPNHALRAGNLLTNGIDDPGSSVRARCGTPQIEVEVVGFPIDWKPHRNRREPPDWRALGHSVQDGVRRRGERPSGLSIRFPLRAKSLSRVSTSASTEA